MSAVDFSDRWPTNVEGDLLVHVQQEVDDYLERNGAQLTAQIAIHATERVDALEAELADAGKKLAYFIEAQKEDNDTIVGLRAELATANIALCSLTPGGSEYANNPASCVEYVRRARNTQHEHILRLSDELATARNDALEKAAKVCKRKAAALAENPENAYVEPDTNALIWTNSDAEWAAAELEEARDAIRALKDKPL